jgi:hypothetical protein
MYAIRCSAFGVAQISVTDIFNSFFYAHFDGCNYTEVKQDVTLFPI